MRIVPHIGEREPPRRVCRTTILNRSTNKAKVPRVPLRRRRGRLHAMCATRSSETKAIRLWGMEGKGQVIEDSHGPSITKNLDNCASIQVR
jgi:hypothetical protein